MVNKRWDDENCPQIGCRSFKDMSQVYQIFCNLIINYKFNEQRCKRPCEIVNANANGKGECGGGWSSDIECLGRGRREVRSIETEVSERGKWKKQMKFYGNHHLNMDGDKASNTIYMKTPCANKWDRCLLAYPSNHSLCMR